MHRLQVPVGLHQMLQWDPFADTELSYPWYSTAWNNSPGDGQRHFSCDDRKPLFSRVLGAFWELERVNDRMAGHCLVQRRDPEFKWMKWMK